ncbi:hypothetical protein ACH5RR_016513, partial [Cinchona calisaya]
MEEEKLDVFNIPLYTPSVEEARYIIEEEASFDILNLETFKLPFDGDFVEEDDRRF